MNSADSTGQSKEYTELKWADLKSGQNLSQTKQKVMKSSEVFEGMKNESSGAQETSQKLFLIFEKMGRFESQPGVFQKESGFIDKSVQI